MGERFLTEKPTLGRSFTKKSRKVLIINTLRLECFGILRQRIRTNFLAKTASNRLIFSQ